MKIYLATWLEDNQGRTLTRMSAERRLLSYYWFLDYTKGDGLKACEILRRYATTGCLEIVSKLNSEGGKDVHGSEEF